MRDMAAPLESAPVMAQNVGYKAGGVWLLRGLDILPQAGGVTALMGPNGAGKSLSLRLMAGLAEPHEGQIRRASNARPALVFQQPVLLRRSARGNLLHALKIYGVPRKTRRMRADALLKSCQLEAQAARPARALSGGEQQRLALARALGAEPELLLLDEPTASLDPQATRLIEALILTAAQEGVKVIIATHDQGQARRIADEILFIHGGRMIEAAPAAQLLNAPQSPEARAYLRGELL